MTVTGFASMPACCRASRSWQFFFVNGRQVKSPLMMAALEEAYKNQRMVGRFPGCVLHLQTKLNAVDVNVHPAKTEVKFGAERAVFSAVYHAVLSALEGDSSHPQAVLKNTELPGVRRQDSVTPNQIPISTPVRPAQAPPPVPPPVPTVVQVHDSTYTPPSGGQTISRPPTGEKASFEREALPQRAEEHSSQRERCSVTPVSQDLPAPHTAPAAGTEEQSLLPYKEPDWRLAGEVLNTYIIVERGETICFIDKHAAHERMNFDRMKAEGYDPMAQTLLSPAVCRLSPQERDVLLAHRELLEEFGFEADELGADLAVRQAPDYLDAADIPAALEELAQRLLATGSADPAAARDELLHTMACKAAIKGGWHSAPQELERVAAAVMSGQVKYCPHGRPVAIELTKKELEKQFKRA